MSEPDIPAIGCEAIGLLIFKQPGFAKRVSRLISERKLPVVYCGRTPMLFPSTWREHCEKQERENSVNAKSVA